MRVAQIVRPADPDRFAAACRDIAVQRLRDAAQYERPPPAGTGARNGANKGSARVIRRTWTRESGFDDDDP